MCGVIDDGRRGDENRITVGRALRHELRGDGAARAGARFHDELLVERLAELLPDDARRDVDRAAGAKATMSRPASSGTSVRMPALRAATMQQ
jgi:hypothetical protein